MIPPAEELVERYVKKRMTTREIAAEYGVSKTQVGRWMRRYGIEPRPANNGLLYRGVEAPSAEALREMVHVQHLSYREIAEKFGVDFTAVPFWLDKHGIERPKAWDQRKRGEYSPADIPAAAERYAAGETLRDIAASIGYSRGQLGRLMREAGIELRPDGWDGGKRHAAADGHLLRSTYELRVDNWLHEHGLMHILEPAYPWDRRYRSDFKVGDAYIEVWGVTENDAYRERRSLKIQRCADSGIDLIQINHWQFAQGRDWTKPLRRLVR